MKVILTETQFNTIAEALTARFTITEVRITFLNKKLNEDYNQYTPPHRKLAINLAGNKIHKYRYISKPNPFDNTVSCDGVSYYFSASFNVDGNPVNGAIRISDHPATPESFADHGYDYGLSIVFDNDSTKVGSRNSLDATVYEYVSNNIGDSAAREVRRLTSEFILAGGDVKIKNNKVISPANIDFERINMHSGNNRRAKDISLFTSSDGKTAKFISPAEGIEVVATMDDKDNYTLSPNELKKFQYGDVITFYKIEDGIPVQLGKKLTVNT